MQESTNPGFLMLQLSSMECQRLFLSLYFKDHIETTKAVITTLRSNGFWAYVPRFDLRAPVYLADAEGNLQLDPALLGLDPHAGTSPTLGFASTQGKSRRFPTGTCKLVTHQEHELRITVPEYQRNLNLRILDVVTVQLSCENWDARARVPPPRLHLVADDKKKL